MLWFEFDVNFVNRCRFWQYKLVCLWLGIGGNEKDAIFFCKLVASFTYWDVFVTWKLNWEVFSCGSINYML